MPLRNLALVCVSVLALAGCKTLVKEVEVVRTVEVFKPVPVPCVTGESQPLDLAVNDSSIASASDIDRLARMYRADNIVLNQRVSEQAAQLEACRRLPSLEVGTIVGAPTNQ